MLHVGAPDPPDRRAHRDPLSRLRVARVPRVLPRLAGAGAGDARRRRRPFRCAAASGRSRSIGVLAASPWRWLEHAGWVVFEDVVLVVLVRARHAGVVGQRRADRRTGKLARATSPATSSARLTDGCSPATGPFSRTILGFGIAGGSAPRQCVSRSDRDPAARTRYLDCPATTGKQLIHFESTLTRPDGTIIIVLENAIGAFDGQGELVEIRGFIRDITERKSIEAELAQGARRGARVGAAQIASSWPT